MFVRSFLVLAALAAAVPAGAATIAGLYSTGVDATGAATTGHGADLHWTLGEAPAYTGGTNGAFPIGPWVADTATSRWITPTTNASDNNAVTTFSFTTTFDLTGYKAATAHVSGTFAADDQTTIFLNGVQVGASNQGGYSFRTGFTLGSGFVAGVNTLTFATLNSGGGPTGANVDLTGTASVPEPAMWGLMVVGFGMIGAATRRRSAAVNA